MNEGYGHSQRYWHLRVDRIFARALAFSLLLHGLVIFAWFAKIKPKPLDITIKTLDVRLIPLSNSKPSPPEPTTPLPADPPAKSPVKPVKKIQPDIKKLITSVQSHERILPDKPKTEEKPPSDNPIKKEITPANDMLAYLNARRQQRQAQEKSDNPPSQETSIQDRLVPEQKRDEVIARNLQQEGTSGLFQIREIVGDSAQFSFRGWQQNGRNTRFEIINVLAGPNERIERGVVRRMIAIIREHYSADFNWQSQRYGRVIVLSARPEDNKALEDFLIQEFFALSVP